MIKDTKSMFLSYEIPSRGSKWLVIFSHFSKFNIYTQLISAFYVKGGDKERMV